MSGLLKKLGLMVVGLLFISSICLAQGARSVRIIHGPGPFTEYRMITFTGESGNGGRLTDDSEAYFVAAKRNPNPMMFVVVATKPEGEGAIGPPVQFNLDDTDSWEDTISNFISAPYGGTSFYIDLQDVSLGTHELEAIIGYDGVQDPFSSGGVAYETATLVVIDMDEENRSVSSTVAGNIYPIDLGFTDFDGKDICYVGVEWSAMPGMPSASNLYLDSACTIPMTGETTLSYTSKERLWGVNDNNKPTTLYYKKPSGGMGASYKVKLVYKPTGSSPANLILRTVSFY